MHEKSKVMLTAVCAIILGKLYVQNIWRYVKLTRYYLNKRIHLNISKGYLRFTRAKTLGLLQTKMNISADWLLKAIPLANMFIKGRFWVAIRKHKEVSNQPGAKSDVNQRPNIGFVSRYLGWRNVRSLFIRPVALSQSQIHEISCISKIHGHSYNIKIITHILPVPTPPLPPYPARTGT